MKKVWTHKKLKGEFKGSYRFIAIAGGNERVFVLSNGEVNKSYESWQSAVYGGWKKK